MRQVQASLCALLLLSLGCGGGGGGGGAGAAANVSGSPSNPFTPTLFITLGNSTIEVPIEPTLTAGGDYLYSGSTTYEEIQPGGPTLVHEITWNFVVPSDNLGDINELLFNGGITIEVDANATSSKDFELQISFPAPAAYQDFALGGGGTVKLNADSSGGTLLCPSSGSPTSFLALVTDDEIGYSIVSCPFSMSASGSGNTSFPFSLSSVTNSQLPASVQSSIGMLVVANISPGDKLTALMAPVVQ